MTKPDRPIRAYIDEEGPSARARRTIVVVRVFGRAFSRTFRGVGHRYVGEAWQRSWERHFEHEWTMVNDTAASIVQVFIEALLSEGVGRDRILAALEKLKGHAEALEGISV